MAKTTVSVPALSKLRGLGFVEGSRIYVWGVRVHCALDVDGKIGE